MFIANPEPYTGACPSIRVCVGPELTRCVHYERALVVPTKAWVNSGANKTMTREKEALKSGRLKAASSIGVTAMFLNMQKLILREHKPCIGPALLPWVYRVL